MAEIKVDPEYGWAVAVTWRFRKGEGLIQRNTLAYTRSDAIKKHNRSWNFEHYPEYEYRLMRRRGEAKAIKVVLQPQEAPDE